VTDAVGAFDAANGAFAAAAAAVGTVERTYGLGGRTVAIRFAGEALVQHFTSAFEHLAVERERADLEVCIWDSASTGVPMPFKPWRDDPACVLGEVRGYHGDRIAAVYEAAADFLHLVDRERGLAVSWVADAARVPWWVGSFPLRLVLHCWLRDEPSQLVHAGAVGVPHGGVLIAGRAGSGKSTTTLACLDSPLRIAGDDYVLLDIEPPYVHGLYGIAKLEPDMVSRFALAGMLVNGERVDSEKPMLGLNVHAPESLSAGFPVRAVMLPRVLGTGDTSVSPATPIDVLHALAPTTVFHMRVDRQRVLAKLGVFARQVPGYWLDTGTELEQIPAAILEIVEA
jgi:hypothetical protein